MRTQPFWKPLLARPPDTVSLGMQGRCVHRDAVFRFTVPVHLVQGKISLTIREAAPLEQQGHGVHLKRCLNGTSMRNQNALGGLSTG